MTGGTRWWSTSFWTGWTLSPTPSTWMRKPKVSVCTEQFECPVVHSPITALWSWSFWRKTRHRIFWSRLVHSGRRARGWQPWSLNPSTDPIATWIGWPTWTEWEGLFCTLISKVKDKLLCISSFPFPLSLWRSTGWSNLRTPLTI